MLEPPFIALIILPQKTDCKAKKNGLPHQISGLVRNDIVFETHRSQVAAERIENPVIAKPEGLWRSVPSLGDKRSVPCAKICYLTIKILFTMKKRVV